MKKKIIIWESIKVDVEKQKVYYKTEDHYHHYLNVPFKDLRFLEKNGKSQTGTWIKAQYWNLRFEILIR